MPRTVWLLVIGMMVNVTGSSFLWPLNTIFIHEHLGKSLSVAGIVLMLNSAASVVGSLLGGSLYDKWGGYRAVISGIVITTLAIAGLTLWHSWPAYIVFLTIIGLGAGIVVPPMFAMAGSAWKEGGRKAFNAMYIAQNVGVAVGSALGGFVASYSFNYIFVANLIMYVLFFLIAFLGYKHITKETIRHSALVEEPLLPSNKPQLRALIILCSSYLVCWICYVQWQSTIATYTQDIHISLKQYSLLWTINGAIIVLGQPLINPIIKKFGSNLKGQILMGIFIFMVSFGVACLANDFNGFLCAMVILTIGEMFVWPSVPAVANLLAPKGKEGFYQGIVNSTATGGRMIGPLLGGILTDSFGMNVLFATLIGLFVVAVILASVYDKALKAKPEQPTEVSM
jgi:MFS family permease